MYDNDSMTCVTLRFSWIVKDLLAASARPGRYGPLSEHLAFMKESGIKTVVNLCEDKITFNDGYSEHFEVVHVPILDGDPPTQKQMEKVMEVVDGAIAGKRACMVHCRGGVGRTATVLAPVIMRLKGMSMDDALNLLRQSGRRTETMQQYRFLENWAREKP